MWIYNSDPRRLNRVPKAPGDFNMQVNHHVDTLFFRAQTIDGQTIHLHFRDIGGVNTADDIFFYDGGWADPVPCLYSSLCVLSPADVLGAPITLQ